MIAQLTRWILVIGLVTVGVGSHQTAWAQASCDVTPANLVSWYELDGNALDSVGGNHGSLTGTASFVGSPTGQALSVPGDGSDVTVPDDSSLDVGTEDFSIAAWIQTSELGVRVIVDKRQTQDVPPFHPHALGYVMFLFDGRLSFQLASGVQFDNYIPAATTPDTADGCWHHVAVTIDRDQADGLKFYVDAENVATFSPTDYDGVSLDSVSDMFIGKNADGTVSTSFDGLIDEVLLYDRALGQLEIDGIFACGDADFCGPSTGVPMMSNRSLIGMALLLMTAVTILVPVLSRYKADCSSPSN